MSVNVMPNPTKVANKVGAISGAICGLWALWNWLTVIPGADVLAEGIRVQQILQNPTLALTYPGQNYGGTLEYPFLMISEWVFPHNAYALTFWRVGFAFIIGYLAAVLFVEYFPQGRRWVFLIAVAVGPAVLHGRTGPSGNEVGSIWLNAIYPFSWLLTLLGFLLITIGFKRSGRRVFLYLIAGGIVVGLGIYEQPSTFILTFALLAITVFRTKGTIKGWFVAAIGIGIGLIPMILAAGPFKTVTGGTPSHFPTPTIQTAMRALGLTGESDAFNAIIPNSLGLAAGESLLGNLPNRIIIIGSLFLLLAGLVYSTLGKSGTNRGVIRALSAGWLLAVLGILALDSVMETVWFYGIGLSVVLWMTLGAVSGLRPMWLSTSLCLLYIAVIAFASIAHSHSHIRAFGSELAAKKNLVQTATQDSRKLVDAKISYVFGSYMDIMPLSYYSSGAIRGISNHYDRFPLSNRELENTTINVVVNSTPTDPWGTEALAKVRAKCVASSRFVELSNGLYQAYTCPPGVINMNPS